MDKKILTNKYYISILAVLSVLLWGSAFPVLKITYAELNIPAGDAPSRMVLAGMRFLLAGLLLFALGFIKNKKISMPDKNVLPHLLMLGVLNTTIQYFFFYNGLAQTTGIKGAVLGSSGTFFTIILAHFFYKDDKMNMGKTVGLLFGMMGIFFVNWKKGVTGFSLDFSFFGEGFLMMSGLTSAFATFYAKKLSKDTNPIIINSWQFVAGAILLMVLGVSLGEINLSFTPLAIGLLIYSAILSATAFTVWFNLLKYNSASKVTIFKFLIPVFGTTLSAILIPQEQFTIMIVIGLCAASMGIYLVNKVKK